MRKPLKVVKEGMQIMQTTRCKPRRLLIQCWLLPPLAVISPFIGQVVVVLLEILEIKTWRMRNTQCPAGVLQLQHASLAVGLYLLYALHCIQWTKCRRCTSCLRRIFESHHSQFFQLLSPPALLSPTTSL